MDETPFKLTGAQLCDPRLILDCGFDAAIERTSDVLSPGSGSGVPVDPEVTLIPILSVLVNSPS